MPETATASLSLGEAARQYLMTLTVEARQEQTADLNRFVRWYGGERPLASLAGSMIERYTEENARAADAQRRLDSVRQFLAWCKKVGHATENLGVHIRLRKSASNSNATTITADRIEVTVAGKAALEKELDSLRGERPRIAEQLRTAMADKDFRENAPLDAAREYQAHVEARIRELEAMLKRAVTVEHGASSGKVRLGSKVRLRELASGKEVIYTLVGPGEVNAGEGKISVASPVGKALLERTEGEELEVSAPSRTFRYRLEAIMG